MTLICLFLKEDSKVGMPWWGGGTTLAEQNMKLLILTEKKIGNIKYHGNYI